MLLRVGAGDASLCLTPGVLRAKTDDGLELPDIAGLVAEGRQGAARSLLEKSGCGLGGLLTPKGREER